LKKQQTLRESITSNTVYWNYIGPGWLIYEYGPYKLVIVITLYTCMLSNIQLSQEKAKECYCKKKHK